MGDGLANTAAAAAETAEAERRRAAEDSEATARAEGLETQVRMKAELEEQPRRAEEAEKLRKEQEAAGATRSQDGRVVAVALMVRAPLTEAIRFNLKLAMIHVARRRPTRLLVANLKVSIGAGERRESSAGECQPGGSSLPASDQGRVRTRDFSH